MTEGLSNKGFDLDLLDAKQRERRLWDLLGRRVELKTDFKASTTGNVFLEYKSHGQPSGIATTHATWWVWEFADGTLVIMTTQKLRSLGQRAWKEGRQAPGGDEDTSEGVLIPLAWLLYPWALEEPADVVGMATIETPDTNS